MPARTICSSQAEMGGQFAAGEKSTRLVLILSAVVTLVEIVGGFKLNSMALLADGWHMATHVAVFGIAVAAYVLTRRYAHNDSFSFGTGKVCVLAAFISALTLGVIGLLMAGESLLRLFDPKPIQFNQAIMVASLGLGFNLLSAWLLRGQNHSACTHHHHPHHGCGHAHTRDSRNAANAHAHDLNLKAAYLHVLADAVTSLLALVALVGGKLFGWAWLDAVVGLAGAGVVAQWSWSLLRDTTAILLDKQPLDSNLHEEIRSALQSDPGTVITDLHLWQIAANKYAAIISITSPRPKTALAYKQLLKQCRQLVHVTVEVHECNPSESLRWIPVMQSIGLVNCASR